MKATKQVARKTRPGFLQVLAGEPSESEIEEHYLALARLLLHPDRTATRVA